jgi:hypothetical protein
MLHPGLISRHEPDWPVYTSPKSIDEWNNKENMKTVKLDVLAHITKHHLENDSAVPLKVGLDCHSVIQRTPDEEVGQPYTDPTDEPDKIIIYSAFPSSNHAIQDVCKFTFNLYSSL